MKQEVLIKEPLKTFVVMAPSFFTSLYFSINGDTIFYYVTITILLIIIYFSYKEKDKKRLICCFDEGVIYFPSIGRQLEANAIDKIDIYKSKLTFIYIIKIYSHAYDNDILKIKVTNKQSATLMLKLFQSINIDDDLIKRKI